MPTYYVDSAATGAADGSSEADAWTTIDTAMNNVVAGDKVWVKASGTYDENANIDTAGTINNWVVFEGYSTSTGDGGRPVWKNSSGQALTDSNTFNYYVFKNFDFDGSSSSAIACDGLLYFYNCYFRNNGVHGAQMFNINNVFVNCEFSGNSFDGLNANTSNQKLVGCK